MARLIRRREQDLPSARHLSPFQWDPYSMFRDFWDPLTESESLMGLTERGFRPDIEVKETSDAYVFKADLPGVKESDLEISVMGNRITISGKREEEQTREGERYLACEHSYGEFTRSFTLPAGTKTEDVSASLCDGVLMVNVPKVPEVQSKKIPIQAARSEEGAKHSEEGALTGKAKEQKVA